MRGSAPRPSGSGPGSIAPGGSAVELYALLPPMGEPEVVHAAIPAGTSILELGAGAGRTTRDRAARGHREYQVGDRLWRHAFTARRLDDGELAAALAEAGLAQDAYLTGDGPWVRAVPASRGDALGRSPR